MNSGGESLPLPSPEKGADEGYVKYVCLHENAPAPDVPALKELDALRTELFDAGLIGMRQDGIGYGNISLRTEKGFVISATATGGIRELGADGYSLVTEWSLAGNRLSCSGPLPASSEALTHAAVYEAGRDAKCVIHVHSRPLFDGLREAGALCTPPSASYGTPEMALAVADIARAQPQEAVVVMLGHDEGVLAYGPSIGAAASLLSFAVRNFLSNACSGETSCAHGACHVS